MFDTSYLSAPATDPRHPKWQCTRRLLIQLECAEEKRRLGIAPELLLPRRPLRTYGLAMALGMTAGAAVLFVSVAVLRFALDLIAWACLP